MSRRYQNKLFCFSPPVMIATCVTELLLLVYTLWRYHLNQLTRIVAALLTLLAIFQLAEFQVCTGSSYLAQWSHLGYVAITLLPPLGIHAICTIAGKKRSPVVYAAYATGAAFIAYFALSAGALNGHQCLGNYVIFQVNHSLTWLYAVYYFGWVLLGMFMSLYFSKHAKEERQRQALYYFTFGYVAFLLPTTTMNLLARSTVHAIPSILCGFAVLLALVVVLLVMPKAGKLRIKESQ